MARKPRIVIPGLPHHIWHRGNNRRRLFSRHPDYELFLWLVARALQKYPCLLHALVLMSNHFHLILTPREKPHLAAFMKFTNQRYAQIRNDKRDGSGKLFEQSFESKPITTEAQLAVATMYVDANPIRAGIVDDVAAYKWSTSHLRHGDPRRCPVAPSLWTPSPWYVGLGSTPEARATKYRKLFLDYLREPREPDYIDQTNIRRVEALSANPYTRSLRRPNNKRASER